jgi:DNA polymerase III gamma/tau subunit
VRGEKLSVPTEVLAVIANTAEGSFRDATKILEQAILENALNPEKIVKLLGKGGKTSEYFLRLFAKKETAVLLQEISKLATDGTNFTYFTTELLELLHHILLAQHDFQKENVSTGLVELLPKNDILALIKLFSRVYLELKNSVIAQLPLEVAVVEWCETKNNPISK